METWIEQFDEAQISQIHALMKQEWWCCNRTIDEVKAVITGSDVTLAALDEEHKVVAFARALTDGVFKAVLFDVIVKGEYRGSNLGKKIIDKLKQHPSLKHVKSLELYCPDRISGFYTKLDFEISESKLHRFTNSADPIP